MDKTATPPDVLTYLDALRESGDTNMFGAAPYLQGAFGVDYATARAWLSGWMATYADRHPQEQKETA